MANFADLFFPKKCLGCKEEGGYVCTSCIKRVKLNRQTCIECKKPAIDGMTHTGCKKAWGLDGVISVWEFQGIVRKALVKTKYKFAFQIAKELGGYVTYFLKNKITALPQDTTLVPIPLHRRRQRWRGFNQVEVIGMSLAKEMGWEYHPNILERKKLRRPQTELKGSKRKENIRGVFALNKNYQSIVKSPQSRTSSLRGRQRSIVLFDDVSTTGSTLKEAGKVLKRKGAGLVWGLTVAR